MTTHDIAEMLGGKRVFVGRIIHTDLDLVEAVREGLPTQAVDALVSTGALSSDEVEQFVLTEGTSLAERKQEEKLSPDESDRLARIARITALANETFGDPAKAARWLRKPCRALGGVVPISLLSTGEGGRIVEDSLEQLANGIFA